jgi:probable non-F420 flavinoid oxidoreductase
MTSYGYHASHEQLPPGELLELVREAEQAGFASAMCSDHFAPWSERQGNSGHAWTWLGSALASTEFEIGVVSAPGQRYHPAVSAQAIATLADMHPQRFWVALGSGQLLNEHITGEKWPAKEVRNRRLEETANVIRRLLDGDTVTHEGLVKVERARLWSLPEESPPIFAAAVTPETAEGVAGWADGLITVNQPGEGQAETLAAFREAGGKGPALLQVHLSWARDRETALDTAHDQWREAILGSDAGWELALPEHFEQAAQFTRPQDLEPFVHVSEDLDRHAEWLAQQSGHGFDRVMVHHVGKDQAEFIKCFGEHVLPGLRHER